MKTWHVSVPTKECADRYLCLTFDGDAELATFDVPVIRTLADIDDMLVTGLAKAAVSGAPELARMQSRTQMLVDRAVTMAERMYRLGYLQRVTDERRAKCVIGREQLAAIASVTAAQLGGVR